jgi:hypothetical protein
MIRQIAATYPADGAPAKIRTVNTRFKRKARPRTAAELEGLRKGNERRRLEAAQRRAAQATEPAV